MVEAPDESRVSGCVRFTDFYHSFGLWLALSFTFCASLRSDLLRRDQTTACKSWRGSVGRLLFIFVTHCVPAV